MEVSGAGGGGQGLVGYAAQDFLTNVLGLGIPTSNYLLTVNI